MPETKILIVDDHEVVIQGIKCALQEHAEFEVVGEAHDGLHAVEIAKSLSPDIIIMDISMDGLNGVEATTQIRQFDPEVKIIVFSMYSNKEYIVSLFRAGISGYVLKEDPMTDLIFAIKAVKGGGTYFSTMVPSTLVGHLKELEERNKSKDVIEKLSLREREVFCFLADGRTVKEIAAQLHISPKTVESHKYNIMEKLNTRTIADFTKIAVKKNLIRV